MWSFLLIPDVSGTLILSIETSLAGELRRGLHFKAADGEFGGWD